jgi:hypothetical protein
MSLRAPARNTAPAMNPDKRQQIQRVRRFIIFIVVSLLFAHIFILFNFARLFQNLF